MKNCSKCHASNSDDALFCRDCGHSFPKPGRGVRILATVMTLLTLLFAGTALFQHWQITKTNQLIAEQQNISSAARQEIDRRCDSLTSIIDTLRQQISDSTHAHMDFRRLVATYYPMVIFKIDIANVTRTQDIINGFGETIHSEDTQYLQPRLTYRGFIQGNVDLTVKWYKPDGGLLDIFDSSPSGYSQLNQDCFIYPEDKTITLKGIGGSNSGNWRSGTYRIEIWHKDLMLAKSSFTIR